MHARVRARACTHTHTLNSGKRTTWYPYSVVETCGLGWGQVWGWRWEGDQKPKLATLGFRRSRKHSGKSFPFLLLVQRLSTFPSSLSLIFSCKISRICLSFPPHFLLPVFQFRPHSLALCSYTGSRCSPILSIVYAQLVSLHFLSLGTPSPKLHSPQPL